MQSETDSPDKLASLENGDPKKALELKKLALEIAEMERPWWERPNYILAALPTLLAVIALSVGFINGYFSAQLTKLDNQKYDLQRQIREFESTRDALIAQNDQLQQGVQKKQDKLDHIRYLTHHLRDLAALVKELRKQPGVHASQMNKLQDYQQSRLDQLISELTVVIEDEPATQD